MARQWSLPLLLAKSTKGHLSIDWRDQDARSRVITDLAADVIRVVAAVRAELDSIKDGPRKRNLVSRCDALLAVIGQDPVATPDGRLVIAHRVAKDRVISITDPEARHGRKSKSQTFDGSKVNILGDIVSGLIVALSVTAGNGHDAPPGHELIARARRMRVDMTKVLADTAYGGAADRHQLSVVHGIALIAPPPPVSKRGEALGRREFEIDFAAMTATCPNGVTTNTVERIENGAQPHVRFRWRVEACAACPLAQNCLRAKKRDRRTPNDEDAGPAKPIQRRNRARTTGRALDLHPHEEELRAARAAWDDPDVRRMYRDRTQCERLVAQIVRHGGRQARAWGRDSANLQVHAIAMRCNLELLAKRLARSQKESNSRLAA